MKSACAGLHVRKHVRKGRKGTLSLVMLGEASTLRQRLVDELTRYGIGAQTANAIIPASFMLDQDGSIFVHLRGFLYNLSPLNDDQKNVNENVKKFAYEMSLSSAKAMAMYSFYARFPFAFSFEQWFMSDYLTWSVQRNYRSLGPHSFFAPFDLPSEAGRQYLRGVNVAGLSNLNWNGAKKLLGVSCNEKTEEVWFHGTSLASALNVLKKGIICDYGERYLDFGLEPSFCLVSSWTEARDWAIRKGQPTPAILAFRVSYADKLRLKHWDLGEEVTREWEDLVNASRLSFSSRLTKRADSVDWVQGLVGTCEGIEKPDWTPQPSEPRYLQLALKNPWACELFDRNSIGLYYSQQ